MQVRCTTEQTFVVVLDADFRCVHKMLQVFVLGLHCLQLCDVLLVTEIAKQNYQNEGSEAESQTAIALTPIDGADARLEQL